MSSRSRVFLLLVVLAGGLTLHQFPGEGRPTAAQTPGQAEPARTGQLLAGAARVEITSEKVLPVNDPLYVKALVLRKDSATAVLLTVDAVAIGEIGHIGNDYLGKVRARLQKELKIAPESVLVNASHCHGVVRADVDDRTVEAVAQAVRNLVPVKVGVGVGHESRVSENRRLRLKNGKEVDVRHAYSMPADEEVAEVGPIDPQIGVLRLDRLDGQPLAVVYNFACHPILGVPNGGNTADLVGFASRAIENNLGEGTIALFVQGCGGDINPLGYKAIHQPRDAEPLGNLLGLSVLRAVRKIRCAEGEALRIRNEHLDLPRADYTARKLLQALRGTTLNLRTFLELAAKHGVTPEFPSYYSHRYLHEKNLGREDLARLDRENRANMQAYLRNIHIMEELTRLQTNLALLRKHQEQNRLAGMKPLRVEMVGLRVGDFVLLTFPGELTVEIGLNVKKASPHQHTFVAGYTNGYIYYTPTAKQLQNVGGAQEDSDCLLAPEWEKLFYDKVSQMLKKL
jgi:hypothetical protein